MNTTTEMRELTLEELDSVSGASFSSEASVVGGQLMDAFINAALVSPLGPIVATEKAVIEGGISLYRSIKNF